MANGLTLFLILYGYMIGESSSSSSGPSVQTDSGRVVGFYTSKAQVYKSIPYAKPPVGDLRWKDPLPPIPTQDFISATTDPPGCPQKCDLPLSQYTCPPVINEDCLYLNVYAPLNVTSSAKIPVCIFFHGGSFTTEYGGARMYDGQYLVNNTNTILVTVNYRLGALGFLVYGKGQNDPHGNYGIKDQRLAMKWVKRNIANFGGDPDEVTLWGQSAGASSVAIHITSPLSANLFNKAIIESNPLGVTMKDIENARKLGELFALELGCRDLACLYNQSAEDIVTAQMKCNSKVVDMYHLSEMFLQWAPVVDQVDLLDQPVFLLAKGKVPSIAVMMGTTYEETIGYVYGLLHSPVADEDAKILESIFLPFAYNKVHKFYKTRTRDKRMNLAALTTDFLFTCTNRYAMMGMSSRLNLWIYNFNHSASFDGWGKKYSYCNGHSCHGVDVPFEFHAIDLKNITPNAAEVNLSSNMTKYWGNFVRTGDPNDVGANLLLPYWPKYVTSKTTGTKRSKCMRFRTPSSEVIEDYRGKACRFWDSIGYSI